MSNLVEYKDKKVIIYDESSKKTIAESIILEFDRRTQTIVVDSQNFSAEHNSHVSVLIFADNGILEYHGTLRRMAVKDTLGIALYKGKAKEDRKHARYTIRATGTVEHVVIGNKPVSLPSRQTVEIVNISLDGILIRGSSSLLNFNTTFQLRLEIAGENVLLNATVVRIDYIDLKTSEYGCKLNFQCS